MAKKSPVRPPKTPVQQRSRRTVDFILLAATQILGREGFARATTNRIAERAGVGIASLYQYFPNKSTIVSALIKRRSEAHLSALEQVLTQHAQDPMPVLADALAAHMVATIEEHAGAMRQLVLLAPALGELVLIGRLRQRATDLISQELLRRGPSLTPQEAALQGFVLLHSVLGLLHGYLYSNTASVTAADLHRSIGKVVLALALAPDATEPVR